MIDLLKAIAMVMLNGVSKLYGFIVNLPVVVKVPLFLGIVCCFIVLGWWLRGKFG